MRVAFYHNGCVDCAISRMKRIIIKKYHVIIFVQRKLRGLQTILKKSECGRLNIR